MKKNKISDSLTQLISEYQSRLDEKKIKYLPSSEYKFKISQNSKEEILINTIRIESLLNNKPFASQIKNYIQIGFEKELLLEKYENLMNKFLEIFHSDEIANDGKKKTLRKKTQSELDKDIEDAFDDLDKEY